MNAITEAIRANRGLTAVAAMPRTDLTDVSSANDALEACIGAPRCVWQRRLDARDDAIMAEDAATAAQEAWRASRQAAHDAACEAACRLRSVGIPCLSPQYLGRTLTIRRAELVSAVLARATGRELLPADARVVAALIAGGLLRATAVGPEGIDVPTSTYHVFGSGSAFAQAAGGADVVWSEATDAGHNGFVGTNTRHVAMAPGGVVVAQEGTYPGTDAASVFIGTEGEEA